MKTTRLEAFSDGVLAIVITIMVLELKVPKEVNVEALFSVFPVFLSYVLSFIYVGIYWNNHHHLFQIVTKVNGKILWANLNLLFWLSLFPFVTGWMGENHFEKNPTAFYGIVLFMAALAFEILIYCVTKHEGKNSKVAEVYKGDNKMIRSIALYFIGIVVSFFIPFLGILIYTIVALMWVIPEKRIESKLQK